MSKQNAFKFFIEITQNPKLENEIRKISGKYSDVENSIDKVTSLIEKEVLPIAKKYGFEFSARDILEAEHEIYAKKNTELSERLLEAVNGGVSVKVLSTYALSALLCLSMFSSGASAFDAKTHSYTTETGVQVLLDSKNGDKDYLEFFTDEMKQKLEASCNKPDQDEIDYAFAYHFYDPATGKNFIGTDITALSKFCSHFNDAVTLYKKNERDKALEQLARALHFLEDLNTPVHTHNQNVVSAVVDAKRNHTPFEAVCDRVREQVDPKANILTPQDIKEYQSLSLEEFGKQCAIRARDLYNKLANKQIPKEKEKEYYAPIAKEAVKNAQKAVALALDRFYKEVNDISSEDNKPSFKIIENSKDSKELLKGESYVNEFVINERLTRERHIEVGAESFCELGDGTIARTRLVNVTEFMLSNGNRKGNRGEKTAVSFNVRFVYDGESARVLSPKEDVKLNVSEMDKKNYRINAVEATKFFNRGSRCCVKSSYRLYKKEGFFNRLFNMNYGWDQIDNSGIEVQCSPKGLIEVY